MIQNIINALGILCTIFWSTDFSHWKDATNQTYTKKLPDITNYGVFKLHRTTGYIDNPIHLIKIKYINTLNY